MNLVGGALQRRSSSVLGRAERRLPLGAAVLLVSLVVISSATGRSSASSHQDRPVAPQAIRGRIEPSVAVNPRDPDVVLVAATDGNVDPDGGHPGAYLSNDGGQRFRTTGFMPHPKGVFHSADVSVAYDRRGRAFYAYVGIARGVDERAGGVVVARSLDGGVSWSKRPAVPFPHTMGERRCTFQDWPTLAADPTRTRIYIVWHKVVESGEDCGNFLGKRVMVAHADRGSREFSRPIRASGKELAFENAASMAVGPDGAIYVSYIRGLEAPGRDCPSGDIEVYVARSVDGGRSFERTKVAEETCGGQSPNMTGNVNLYATASSIAVNPVSGTIAVAWHDHDAPGQTIHLRVSSDDGRSWRDVVMGDRLFDVYEVPQLAYGRDGRLYMHFIEDSLGGTYQPMLATSSDNGLTWSPPAPLSTQSSVRGVRERGSLGEYLGLAVDSNGVAHTAWTDLRDPDAPPNIWTRRFAP